MDEQVGKQERVTVKSLQQYIANMEADFAAKLSQLESKHGLLYEAHQELQKDFEAYKKMHPLKKLLNSRQKR
jgi:hypothetical protein